MRLTCAAVAGIIGVAHTWFHVSVMSLLNFRRVTAAGAYEVSRLQADCDAACERPSQVVTCRPFPCSFLSTRRAPGAYTFLVASCGCHLTRFIYQRFGSLTQFPDTFSAPSS
ncbi:hypothetical protein BKA81DRAFT_380085 [Phyllosticta paracitricarpa]|uniref:Secreted protein n=1 Tax=Phyllosticta citricarpa TaxID=55181 RepID=A0ABR1LYR2_9PEZI